MLRFANVATPPTAPVVAVPERVPPAGFVPSATDTLPAKLGSILPSASSAETRTEGVMAAPAVVLVGCPVNSKCVAAPAAIVNAALVPPASPGAAADSV